mgnify:CR=1 FL=1|tara:strand:- start:18879 stop:20090 length:1212 start_codon:yes stop_codon:yes gene_type:complete
MTTQAGNWVAESCSTLGTGDIILTGAATGQAGFSGAISAGAVFYSIEDGNSREAGIGTFDGASTIVRGDIRATLVNGNYTKVSPLPINLTGSSVVSCTYNASAYEDVVQSANAAAASAVAAAASAAAALVSENAAAADLVLTNADAAATAADALSTAADVILTTADSVATALDVLATSADVVLTNADVVLTNADVASTNADVVLTTADVVSSAASAAAALVSENAAAASAATIPTYDPLTGEALNFVRLNAGETTMEFRTPAEVLSDVGAEAADATILKDADIGVTVQAYNADTLFADTTDNLSVGITTDVEVLASDTITPDLALESLKTRSVVGNVTINVPSNGNGKCAIRLDIDGTDRTVTLGANVLAVGTIPTLTASATFIAVVTRFSATSATVQIKVAV